MRKALEELAELLWQAKKEAALEAWRRKMRGE